MTEVPINRRSLHNELVERLRDLIVEGELVAGERISEKLLCERFEVSRTPLREALKVLASEGLVEILPNRGAKVSGIAPEDVAEVFPVLSALEGVSGELACAHITDERIAEIRALHYQMVLHFHRGERPAYFKLNQAIHDRILDAAGNPTLSAIHRALTTRVKRARYLANMSETRWRQAIEEHERILEALAARDGPRLAEMLRAHLKTKAETVLEFLRERDGAGVGRSERAPA